MERVFVVSREDHVSSLPRMTITPILLLRRAEQFCTLIITPGQLRDRRK